MAQNVVLSRIYWPKTLWSLSSVGVVVVVGSFCFLLFGIFYVSSSSEFLVALPASVFSQNGPSQAQRHTEVKGGTETRNK